MAHWNHRVVEFPPDAGSDEPTLIVCEVFYNSDGTLHGRNDGARVLGADKQELWQQMEYMRRALCQPILKVSDFPEPVDIFESAAGQPPANP